MIEKDAKPFRKMGTLILAMGVLLGKFGVLDVLTQASQHSDSVRIPFIAALASGALIPLGCMFLLFGERVGECFSVDKESGRPGPASILVSFLIMAPAIALCLWVQFQLRQLGYAA